MRHVKTRQKHRDMFRMVERALVAFILSVCVLSFYLTVVNYDVMSSQNGQTGGHHHHNHQQHFHGPYITRVRRTNFSNQYYKSTNSTNIKPDTSVQDWFSELPKAKAVPISAINQHPIFKGYLIKNDRACKEKVDILIYVHSALSNHERRRAIRETWANKKSFLDITIERVFLVGKASKASDQLKIMNEHITYGDIVQGDFIDSRANLTYKAIMAVNWITSFCAHARYIIKADDEIFVNIFLLVERVISRMGKSPMTLACHKRPNGTSVIMRDSNNKWWVPNNVFQGRTFFPTFCPGYMVLFSGDLVPIMYAATFTNAFFNVDDVYLFGMSLEKANGVSFIDIQAQLSLNADRTLEQLKSDDELLFVASKVYKPDDMLTFWMLSKKRLSPWGKLHISQTALMRKLNN